MTTIRVTDRHRGTVIARSGVLVGVRMTVLPDLPDIGLISLGDRVSDDQPLRTVFSRLVKEEEFRRALETPAMAFTELTLRGQPASFHSFRHRHGSTGPGKSDSRRPCLQSTSVRAAMAMASCVPLVMVPCAVRAMAPRFAEAVAQSIARTAAALAVSLA